MIEGQSSDSLLHRVFSFPIGKRAGKTLWSGWISQNGYDFMGLILECLLKNRYSHYLSYETILGLCPIILAWDRSRYPAQSLTVNHAVNLHSGFTRVDITWTLRDSLVLLSWLRYFDHQSSDLSTDIALRTFELRHGFVSQKLCRVFCLAKTLWVSLETPYAESLWERRAQIRQIQVQLKF